MQIYGPLGQPQPALGAQLQLGNEPLLPPHLGGLLQFQELADDGTVRAASPVPVGSENGFWVQNHYRAEIAELADYLEVDTLSQPSVVRGTQALYDVVVTRNLTVLIPYPLDASGAWLPMGTFLDPSNPFMHARAYIANLCLNLPFFMKGHKAWKAFITLLESGEARALYDPVTKGSYLQATRENVGAFTHLSQLPLGASDPNKRQKNVHEGTPWGGVVPPHLPLA